MIVTRSWLEEFIDLEGIDDHTIYETLNAIGLEVERIEKIAIPEKVVIGKIVSCEKHPDADKLNVCRIDVGSGVRQIVCGAANVVDAEYVAVATIGAVLPGDFTIKHAKLRGVESEGMVCASTEIGMPSTEKGIMILDDSIGTLEAGRELREYAKVADTIIEIELTANRGDCLSVYGVARDLAAALNRELKPFEFKQDERLKLGIGRKAELHVKGEIEADACYKLMQVESVRTNALMRIRLAFANVETHNVFDAHTRYAMHATGVMLRMYDCPKANGEEDKTTLVLESRRKGLVDLFVQGKHAATIGVWEDEACKPEHTRGDIFIEASYIDPDLLSEATAQDKNIVKDELYYFSSRGTNPDLAFGFDYLGWMLHQTSQTECYEGVLSSLLEREVRKIRVDADMIEAIIGMPIEMSKIATILKKLGFEVTAMNDRQLACTVPPFRHDISHIYDVAEEIVRMVGINRIPNTPLCFTESDRQNETYRRFKAKSRLRQRAVAAGFFETVTYLFADRVQLERYGFETLDAREDLTNPIVDELNTLRSTILVNLLQALKRNANYGKRRIALFEAGAVFDAHRKQSERVAFVYAGQKEAEGVDNSGKPEPIDFSSFVDRLSRVIGPFRLTACTVANGLIHPYQSADILIDGQKAGFVAKLHLGVQEEWGLPTTYIAEVDTDYLLPHDRFAGSISNYQGTFKDLSIVIDRSLPYEQVREAIEALDEPLLRRFYPIDTYHDETLGDRHSLTVRFFIQSDEKTLEDSDIEAVMGRILSKLEDACGATLR